MTSKRGCERCDRLARALREANAGVVAWLRELADEHNRENRPIVATHIDVVALRIEKGDCAALTDITESEEEVSER